MKILKKLVIITMLAILVGATVMQPTYVEAADPTVRVTDGQGTVVNINVSGENSESSTMKLVDMSGNTIATWDVGDDNAVYSDDSNDPDIGTFNVNLYELLDVASVEKLISAEYREYRWETLSNTKVGLKYDTIYNVRLTDNNYEDYVLPAGNVMFYVDDGYGDMAHAHSLEVFNDENEILLKDLAGKRNFYTPTSEMDYTLRKAGAMGINGTVSPSTSSETYVKVKLRLSMLYPSDFFRDGTFKIWENGGYVPLDWFTDPEDDPNETPGVCCVRSGSVVNVVCPDEKGYVEVYLKKKTHEVYYHMVIGQGLYGGLFSHQTCTYNVGPNVDEINVTTVRLPSTGVNVVNLKAGNYRLIELSASGEALGSETITVDDSKEVQYYTYELGKEVASQKETTTQKEATTHKETTTKKNNTTSREITTNEIVSSSQNSTSTIEQGTTGIDEETTTEKMLNENPEETILVAENSSEEMTTSKVEEETEETTTLQESTSEGRQEESDNDDEGGFGWIIALVVLLLVAGGAGGFVIVKKYREKSEEK